MPTTTYQMLADLVVLIHFAFIVFVMVGGFLALKWRFIRWLHLPAVLWAAIVEFAGWICPLTPLENAFRAMGGGNAYSSDFVERYLITLIYPDALTRETQIVLGMICVLVNAGIYAYLWRRSGRLSGRA
jgi:hypothetical protein